MKKNTQKSNHCYLSLSSSVVSFECGRTKAPWSSLVSEMFGNFSFVSVRSSVICSCPLGAWCTEMPWWCLLASESFVDCGNRPENLVGAKRVALNHFFSSPVDTCGGYLVCSVKRAALGHFGNRFVEKPSVLSQIAEVVSWNLSGGGGSRFSKKKKNSTYFAPKRTGYLEWRNGHFNHKISFRV